MLFLSRHLHWLLPPINSCVPLPPTVEVVELWTIFDEHFSLLCQSSNIGRCISTDHMFANQKEFVGYLAYPSSYTHFIVSIIPRLQLWALLNQMN